MPYKFKLFKTEEEYKQFCQKAGLHPRCVEHSAHDGNYRFYWFYMQEKDYSYRLYILGAYEHPDGEHIWITDKAHQYIVERNAEIDAWMHTAEGREAFKATHRCYPEDLVQDVNDHFASKPRWQCKGKFVPVYPEYHYEDK